MQVPEGVREVATRLQVDKLIGTQCLELFDMGCATRMLSKLLGSAVVVGSSLVKVPQIAKVVRSRSAFGLSHLSLFLETLGYAITVAYCFAQSFPFSTYGENVFLLVQDILLAVFVAVFAHVPLSRVLAIAAAVSAVLSGVILRCLIPIPVLVVAQAATIPIFTASKVPQIALNWRNGSTGQLAFATYILNFGGSLARIFTTLSELNDPLVLTGYVLGAVFNGIISAQIVWYSLRKTSETGDKVKKQN